MPLKLQLYGLYVYYVVHICNFGMLRVKLIVHVPVTVLPKVTSGKRTDVPKVELCEQRVNSQVDIKTWKINISHRVSCLRIKRYMYLHFNLRLKTNTGLYFLKIHSRQVCFMFTFQRGKPGYHQGIKRWLFYITIAYSVARPREATVHCWSRWLNFLTKPGCNSEMLQCTNVLEM